MSDVDWMLDTPLHTPRRRVPNQPDNDAPHPADTAARNGHTQPGNGDGELGWRAQIIDGRTWLTDGPDQPEAIWGDDDTVLWAKGQPLVIAGPQGAGKTVFGQRLALGQLGICDCLLDWPIQPTGGRVLYLAADRPEQARLSMRRMVKHADFDYLADTLRVWRGPPPYDFAKSPSILHEMALAAEATTVVLDSLKDVALKLSDDEVGAAVNRAIQRCVAAGIEIASLHHPRKLGGIDRADKPRSIDDLYGSIWLTSGAGSVIYLSAAEGGSHELAQFKSPIGTEATRRYTHDHATGAVATAEKPDLARIVADAADEGITATWAASCFFRVDEPEEKHTKAIKRKLRLLEEAGVAEALPAKPGSPIRWRTTQ